MGTIDNQTSRALADAVEIWEGNALAQVVGEAKLSLADSPLCCRFNLPFMLENACKGCPIREATGSSHCMGSPIARAATALLMWKMWPDSTEWAGEFRARSADVVVFLRGLSDSACENGNLS